MKKIIVSIVILFSVLSLEAQQNFGLRGKVYDFKTRKELPGATIQLLNTDSSLVTQDKALNYWEDGDRKGYHSDFNLVVPRKEATYILKSSFVGYKTLYMTINLDKIYKRENYRQLPEILMHEDSKLLKDVRVSTTKVMFYYRGDTVVYNADAFVLAKGSMLDALVRQMPGVEIKKNGDIYHNGRLVQSLLLNGKDFFKSNNKVMLDNLPTYMVNQIRVYEKLGDKSKFVGAELPGDKEYVMDVRLKKEYSIGWVANAEAGSGIAGNQGSNVNPYMEKLFAMRFTDHSRISFYNNINSLNDDRKPGEDDGWTPQEMKEGTIKEKLAGVDYDIDSRNQKWKLHGETNFSHNILKTEEAINRTNFLTTGDTYERISNNSRNKTLSLSTNHSLDLTFKMFRLHINPSISYRKYDNTSNLGSEAYGDTIINRYFSDGLKKGREWNLGLSASSQIKFKNNTTDNLEVGANVKAAEKKDDTFNRYALYLGSSDVTSKHADQYYKNYPDHNYSIDGFVTYNRTLSKEYYFSLQYSLKHKEAEQNLHLYLLDKLNNYQQGNLGELPSVIDYELITDWNNSYRSKLYETSSEVFPNLSYHCTTNKGKWYGELRIPLTFSHSKLEYVRGSVDTTLTRNTFLAGLSSSFIIWTSKDHSLNAELLYDIIPQTPDLVYMVNLYDNADPLNIKEGNSNLKNSYNHSFRLGCSTNKKMSQYVILDCKFTNNAIAMGYVYDTATGIRTYKAYNVNGNWETTGSYGFSLNLDKKKRLTFNSDTEPGYRRNVDLLGENTTDGVAKSIVNTESMHENISLTYHVGKLSVGAKADGQWKYINSARKDFNKINVWDYNYGLTGTFQMPWNVQLSTDLTNFSRRGYNDKNLNTNDLVWNARLSYTTLKGNLILMLDGFDILGNLTNISYTLNGQGRTEVRCNVLPQYVMFHMLFKLSKKQKH
jgi:hypothetical protein